MADGPKLAELEARLAAVRRETIESFEPRARALRAAAERLAGDPGARNEIRRLAHRVRGVAGSAGHPELSELSARLEEAAAAASDLALAEGARRLAGALEGAGRVAAPRLVRSADDGERAKRIAAPAGDPSADAPLGLRVVALDDDATTRRLLELTLVAIGRCDATVLSAAPEALERLRAGGVELVIVDAMMPEVSGLEMYRAVRRAAGPDLPVAILSAASPEELGWALPDDPKLTWLRKPFRPAALIAELRAFVARAG
ncbi:MAG TPA: response regulator [Sandaracinaceae bacterium]